MKNFKRKLFSSVLALFFAFTTMATSTYAWFSMNNTVTATGMQVTAKSDTTFLLIGTGDKDTAEEIQAITPVSIVADLTIAANESKVLPSAHNAIANTEAAASLSNWYFKRADAPSSSASTSNATVLTAFDNYVLHKTVYITLAQGSEDASNLKVAATITSNGTSTADAKTFAPVKVLVTSASASTELSSASASSETVLAATVTDDAVVQIDIWIYYDGNDSLVYTNNMANLDGANINLSFSVTQPTA